MSGVALILAHSNSTIAATTETGTLNVSSTVVTSCSLVSIPSIDFDNIEDTFNQDATIDYIVEDDIIVKWPLNQSYSVALDGGQSSPNFRYPKD